MLEPLYSMPWYGMLATIGFFIVFAIACAVVFGGLFQARQYVHVKNTILARKNLNYAGAHVVSIPIPVGILNPFGPEGAFSTFQEWHWFGAGLATVLGIFDRREMSDADLKDERDDKLHYYGGIAAGVLAPAIVLGLIQWQLNGFDPGYQAFLGAALGLLAYAERCRRLPHNYPG